MINRVFIEIFEVSEQFNILSNQDSDCSEKLCNGGQCLSNLLFQECDCRKVFQNGQSCNSCMNYIFISDFV